MKLKYWILQALKKAADQLGYALIPKGKQVSSTMSRALPADAEAYLRPDNPRILELQTRYAECDTAVTGASVWKEGLVVADDLRYFRGENAYVWQTRAGNTEANYALTAYYLKTRDSLQLLERLDEDDAFGVHTFEVAGRKVSRDLLDSVRELIFLHQHLDITAIQDLRVLDIGAGYGRLAHRMATALPNLAEYICTDAVAASTFICEYYTRYRGVNNKVRVVPLHEIEGLRDSRIDIAINIHSFSECTLSAIEWWCRLAASMGITYFMIVPNPGNHGGSRLSTTPGDHDFQYIVEAAGYRLLRREPKYDDPSVQRGGLFPSYYYLFRLSDSPASE